MDPWVPAQTGHGVRACVLNGVHVLSLPSTSRRASSTVPRPRIPSSRSTSSTHSHFSVFFQVMDPSLPESQPEMKSPQELFDEIISYLPTSGGTNYSLVSRSWRRTRKKYLPKAVETPPGAFRQQDHDMLKNTVHLTCFDEDLSTLWPVGPAYDISHDQVHPLYQLRHLTLCDTTIELPPEEIGFFSIFRSTLSRITFSHCKISKSVLHALFGYFPNLQWLCIGEAVSFYSPHGSTTPDFTRVVEKLFIAMGYFGSPYRRAYDNLSKLGLHFNEIALDPNPSPDCHWMASANSVIRVFGANVKCLRMPEIFSGMYNLLYSHCLVIILS